MAKLKTPPPQFDSPIELNPALNYLGTETAFGFGAEVMKVEQSKKFPQVFKFHIGDTGPKTPEPIIAVAIQALKNKQTKYGHYLGFPQVRKNIARYIQKTRKVKVDADNIILEPGGKPAIELAIQTLVGPKDYVVGQNPGFPIYESLAKFYTQGRYIPWLAVEKKEGLLEFDVKDLENILKGRNIKLLIINTPQNPTGIMLTKNKLLGIAALAKKYNFMVLFDDIYDQIVFGNRKHFSLLSVQGMLERTINLNGYSKNYAMTGWRLGYVVAPKWLIKIFGNLAINKWSCVSRVNQIVAGAIFGDVELDGFKYPSLFKKLEPLVRADVKEYERKGNFLVEALSLLKPYVIPNPVEGAFYNFPGIKNLLNLDYVKKTLKIKTDKEFSRWLLYQNGIAVLPGSDFGQGGAGHMRFSYAEDRNKHIIPGVKQFIKIAIDLISKSKINFLLASKDVDGKVDKIAKKYFK